MNLPHYHEAATAGVAVLHDIVRLHYLHMEFYLQGWQRNINEPV